MSENKQTIYDTAAKDPLIKTVVGVTAGLTIGRNLDGILNGSKKMLKNIEHNIKDTYDSGMDKIKNMDYKKKAIQAAGMASGLIGANLVYDASEQKKKNKADTYKSSD